MNQVVKALLYALVVLVLLNPVSVCLYIALAIGIWSPYALISVPIAIIYCWPWVDARDDNFELDEKAIDILTIS